MEVGVLYAPLIESIYMKHIKRKYRSFELRRNGKGLSLAVLEVFTPAPASRSIDGQHIFPMCGGADIKVIRYVTDDSAVLVQFPAPALKAWRIGDQANINAVGF